MGDYTLTPAYDLMCTVIHTPQESDTALDLYKGDTDGEFYSRYGFFGQPEFRTLAEKIGIQPIRTERIFAHLLSSQNEVLQMIQHSLLSEETKIQYENNYLDKLSRMRMTI
jgi:serine/threonine-protein kinase HipA